MKALARTLCVDPAHLSRIESGKSVVSDSLADKLSSVLHCNREELLLLAGKLPADIRSILIENPRKACRILRSLKPGHDDQTDYENSSKPRRSAAKYKLIDLFCGAGGLTAGFVSTDRFQPVFANDFDKNSVDSYNLNFGTHCVHGDINDLLSHSDFQVPECDVLIGGLPCQGFSLLNKQRDNDPRKQLWQAFMGVLERACPKLFVIENVPEILSSEEFSEIVESARSIGYENIIGKVLNAADYGVPQRRKRAIIIGARFGLMPFHPLPTHCNVHDRKVGGRGSLLPWETVRRAIGDLGCPEGTEIRYDEMPPLDLHFGRAPRPMSLERYKCIPEGGNRFDLQKTRLDLTPQCWIKKTNGGTDLFGRLWWDRPAFTIRTEFFKPEKGRYLHPEQHRPITHREAARLQTFPDSFLFSGPKIAIAKQIGNAVPVLLAHRIGEVMAALLDGASIKDLIDQTSISDALGGVGALR